MSSLLTGLQAWWEFEEDAGEGHVIMDQSGNGRHMPTEGSFSNNVKNWGERSAERAAGKIGFGIKPTTFTYLPMTSQWDFSSDTEITIAGWIKPGISTFEAGYGAYIAYREQGATAYYKLGINGGGPSLEFVYATSVDTISISLIEPLEPDRWYFCVAWLDPEGTGKVHLLIDDETTDSENGPAGWQKVSTDKPLVIGANDFAPPTGTTIFDGIAIWNRVLTAEERTWLYNKGAGRSYSEINPTTTDPEVLLACNSESCCPPTEFGNAAECAPHEASVAVGTPKACVEQADVFFDPPDGTTVVFPIWVRLYSDNAAATIRYTTDGTDPLDSSTIYTAPIAVTEASTIIKARAYVENCPDGDVFSATWTPTEVPMIFCFKGEQGDNAGQWGVFTGNGTTDLRFWWEIEDAVNELEIQRLEIYQLDSNLLWTTGQAWSTAEYITPPFNTWTGGLFHVFPLVLFDQVPVQLNSEYVDDLTDTLGNFPEGDSQYDLYGDPVVAAADYFVLRLIFSDGSEIRLYTDTTICEDPPPCPPLNPPVLTELCKRIDVDATVPGASKAYEVYAAPCTDPDNFTLITSGTTTGAIPTFSYTSLQANCEYCFYWRVNWTGDATYNHCGWVSSAKVCATTSCEPSASLTAVPAVVCVDDAFVLNYVTACAADGASISLISGTPGDLDVAFPFAVDSGTSGSLEVTPSAVGSWTLRLTAPTPLAGCSNDTSDVVLTAINTPEYESDCSVHSSVVQITSYRQNSAVNPLQAIDHDIIRALYAPGASFLWHAPCGCCQTELGYDAPVWNFQFINLDPETLCHWGMFGGSFVVPISEGGNNAGVALAKNHPENPSFYYHYHTLAQGTAIRVNFTDLWVMELRAKRFLQTSIFEPECWDTASLLLWRGFKDCSGGPLGEYVSDWYFTPLPGGEVTETRVENSHIYSLKVE